MGDSGPAATSARDGTFELKGLDPGMGLLQVRLPGFAPAVQQATVPLAKDAPLDLKLLSVLPVRGKVRDKEGKPVEGAHVYASQTDRTLDRFGYEPIRGVNTGPEGDYAIAEVPKRKVTINASKEGYRSVSVEQDYTAREGEATVDFGLERLRYGKLRGRVLRADGKPAAGVKLYVWVDGASGSQPTTDEEGVYVCERIAAGTARAQVQGPVVAGPGDAIEVVADQETVAPDIRLVAWGTLEGKVLGIEHAPKGAQTMASFSIDPQTEAGQVTGGGDTRLYLAKAQPSEGVPAAVQRGSGHVRWLVYSAAGLGWSTRRSGTTGGYATIQPDGAFRMEQARVGTGQITIQSSSETDGFVLQQVGAVTIAEGQPTRAEVTLQPGGSLSGRVWRPDGAPPSQRPMLALTRRGTNARAAAAFIRPDGTFSLAGIPAGDYLAVVWEPGLAGVQRTLTIRAGETAALDLDLVPGVTLRGKVHGEHPKELYVSVESDASFGGVQVGEDGTFAIEHLLPGTYALRLWIPEGPKVGEAQKVDVDPAGAEGVVAVWK